MFIVDTVDVGVVAMWSVHVYHRYRGCVYGCYAECPCLQ